MENITIVEKQRRRQIAESVIGTHAMEGLHVDTETRRILDGYAEGELTLAQFSTAMEQHAADVLKELHTRALAGAA